MPHALPRAPPLPLTPRARPSRRGQVVADNTPRFRFSTVVDGQEAFLDYKVNESAKLVEIAYIWVPAEYREQGVAGLLLTRLHELCKSRGLRCSPSTEARSYVQRWIAENPAYKDICQVRPVATCRKISCVHGPTRARQLTFVFPRPCSAEEGRREAEEGQGTQASWGGERGEA